MKKEFIDQIWTILKKYYSNEIIISQTRGSEVHKDIADSERYIYKIFLEDIATQEEKEKAIANWIERFLNNLELINYDLESFSYFYQEIDSLLIYYNYRIFELAGYQKSYEIETPAKKLEDIKLSEMMRGHDEAFEKHLEEEFDESEKDNITVAKHNQHLLVNFVEASEVYLKLLRLYFHDKEITITSEKSFVRSIKDMSESIKKLSLGIASLDFTSFKRVVPFESLYSLEEDWVNSLKKDSNKNWFHYLTISDYGFNIENIQSLIKPILKKMSLLIEEENIKVSFPIKQSDMSDFYITKMNDDFKYKGKVLNLSRDNDYYKTFTTLYEKLPEGGEITYKDLTTELKSRRPEMKSKSDEEMRKFIQTNLTDKSNGFMRYAKIPETEDNGKPLIKIIRSYGVRFNNKIG